MHVHETKLWVRVAHGLEPNWLYKNITPPDWLCVGHLSDMYITCILHVYGMCKTCVGHV